MPNWTYNRIKCKKELGDKLLTINEGNYSLDFNKLKPMPEDLKLDAGTIENKSISCYYLSLSDEDKLKLMKLLKNKEVFFHHNYWNKYKSDIKNFEESKPNMLVLNITNLTEEQKAKLRGAIKFFNGEQNNIRVMVKINEELKPCGAIYLTDEILKVFEEIVGKENCQ